MSIRIIIILTLTKFDSIKENCHLNNNHKNYLQIICLFIKYNNNKYTNMQILCAHCKSIFQSHIFNLAYFIKFFISSNYIPFVQIISPQKFSSHIFSLSLSQFYLQIQSNTSPPTFSVLYVFPSHPRTSNRPFSVS